MLANAQRNPLQRSAFRGMTSWEQDESPRPIFAASQCRSVPMSQRPNVAGRRHARSEVSQAAMDAMKTTPGTAGVGQLNPSWGEAKS